MIFHIASGKSFEKDFFILLYFKNFSLPSVMVFQSYFFLARQEANLRHLKGLSYEIDFENVDEN
jgi:hypothetical protein